MDRMNFSLRELKFDPSSAASMTFEGYGAVFGNVDSYGDVIDPGAFAVCLADVKAGRRAWPAMLSQHGGFGLVADDLTPIGVWEDLSEDGTGLRVKGRLADTPRGRDLYTLMRMEPRPAIDGLSIGFIPKEWEPRSKPDDPRRRIKRIDLLEISPVTFPANGRARVSSVKSLGTARDLERLLRDAGLSAAQAKAIAAGGFDALSASGTATARAVRDELTRRRASIAAL
ncbi:MAG: HK97 family phage prohead protease [Burkholderiales bacterium]|nr:HK97 family phage prohead protease [Burkholderiales bacterium]